MSRGGTEGAERGDGAGRPRLQRPDRIEIRDLRVLATHGVLAEERARPQPFSIDLDVRLVGPADGSGDGDDGSPGGSRGDDLSQTADYAGLCDVVVHVVTTRSDQLLETVADAVAHAVLEGDRQVASVTVSLRKLRPPLPYDVASVGVRVTRGRKESAEGGRPA